MKIKTSPAANVDDYILGFPAKTQKMLVQLRNIIIKQVPEAEETISYLIPAYKYYGVLVYFAGYKNHIGFYPRVSGIAIYREELAGYKHTKGTVQFPLDSPLPLRLIKKIIDFRVKENLATAGLTVKKKKLPAKNVAMPGTV